LGFSDEFYFSRIFKKNEGVSPSQYYSKIVHGV
ncbi:MAG TPA: AraC family transcriptional regulator, partial [Firmicutes bacterium]|nr:AraC family transcriptional regulator [Bacillota bacterium]